MTISSVEVPPQTQNPQKILQEIRELVAADLAGMEKCVETELSSSVPLTRDITHHIFKTKGKQLRPLLVILASHACTPEKSLTSKHYELALLLEFVHTATLLHDDVVDHSTLRRGQKTANAIWNNSASVLVGDFLYSRAFQMLARHPQTEILKVLADTTNAIAEGEVMQLMNQHDARLSEENYFQVITQKTAQLFSAAAEIGALLEDANPAQQKALADYGLHLGITFQIIDDLLDYETSADITGKNIGDDLSEGKITLPLIYALEKTTAEKATLIRKAISTADKTALPEIVKILQETNAFDATRQRASLSANLAQEALLQLPESSYRDALQQLVEFAIKRSF